MGKGSIGENRGAGREGAAKEVRDGLGSSVFNVQIGQMGWPLLVVNLIYQAHETAGAENSSLERAAAAAVEGWGKPHCSTRRWNYVHWGCGEDASTDERWDCVSGKCVSANVSTQVKRRWNHPRSGRDSFYSYCHPFHADSYVSPPHTCRFLSPSPPRPPALPCCQGDTLCTSFPAAHTHTLSPRVGKEGRYIINWFPLGPPPPRKTIPLK